MPTEAALGAAPPLPSGVAAEIASRAEAIRSRDLGRCFDLSSPGARTELAELARAGAPGSGDYDAVVSVAELVLFADLPAALRALGGLVKPGGEMWLLEPIGRPGLWASALAWLCSASPSLGGINLNRDVVGAVRAIGMVVTDVERFTVPGAPWPLQRFVQLRATWVEVPR